MNESQLMQFLGLINHFTLVVVIPMCYTKLFKIYNFSQTQLFIVVTHSYIHGKGPLLWEVVQSYTGRLFLLILTFKKNHYDKRPIVCVIRNQSRIQLRAIYRVIHKSLRDFRTRVRNNQDRHGRKVHINR